MAAAFSLDRASAADLMQAATEDGRAAGHIGAVLVLDTVTFAASSYAGTLRITILSDPARMPDVPALAAALRHELSPRRS